jgi:uncharacterized protein
MSLKIDQDHSRFRNIVRGKIRQNLRRYISQGEMIGRKGRDLVSIPVPQIDIPHFIYGQKQSGGVSEGEGQPGDPVGGAQGQEAQSGSGKAGEGAGDHVLEVDITLDELADILGEELEERTARRSVVRFPAAFTIRRTLWSFRSGRTSDTARGRRARNRSPTP